MSEQSVTAVPEQADLLERIKILSLNPLLGYVDDFVRPEKLQVFLNGLDPRAFAEAKIGLTDEKVKTEYRSSKEKRFAVGENAFVDKLRERVTALLNLPEELCEEPALLHYKTGGEYKQHIDACSFRDGIESKRARPLVRIYTGILYLNDDFEGGMTEFPRLGTSVHPKAGRLVVWQNMPGGSTGIHPMSLHAGLPVTSGEKSILSFWMATPMSMRELTQMQRERQDGSVSP
ncbi:prolyl hydroxylase family protein [Halocynthiibacter sp.]|uniref:prolyl hydroxylase family protein n=1 Tax=Halocynthiibacter sp. TaxID=1979210 RepID=UPI003C47652C